MQMISNQATVSVAAQTNLSNQNRITCICCKTKFESTESQRAHFKSEWHQYNLKRKVCHLDSIDLDSFEKIQAAIPAKPQREDKKTSNVSSSNLIDSSINSPSESAKQSDSGDEDWIELDDDQLLSEDYDEEDAEEMLARVVKSDTCLFCCKKSSTMNENIKHMNLIHGFFVPETKYMIDLDGFMEYLGFKVGAGATCLWCNKQFSSVHGVRRHMINKDHCKILYDQEKSSEFKEFYDYSTQEKIPMKPINELVVLKRYHERKTNYSSSSNSLQSSGHCESGKAIVKKNGQSMLVRPGEARALKKFDAYRAKILLRTGMANNQTMRGRLRQQNPI